MEGFPLSKRRRKRRGQGKKYVGVREGIGGEEEEKLLSM